MFEIKLNEPIKLKYSILNSIVAMLNDISHVSLKWQKRENASFAGTSKSKGLAKRWS
jgi:hypothetical protein